MRVKIKIPLVLQGIANNQKEIAITAADIKGLVSNLDKKYPGFGKKIYSSNGKIHPFINIYVNEEDIRLLECDKTKLCDGDEVLIIPAISGG